MKIRGCLSDLVGLMGIGLTLYPVLYFDDFGWLEYGLILLGAIFMGISRADALGQLLGKGNPGDQSIHEFLLWLKRCRERHFSKGPGKEG